MSHKVFFKHEIRCDSHTRWHYNHGLLPRNLICRVEAPVTTTENTTRVEAKRKKIVTVEFLECPFGHGGEGLAVNNIRMVSRQCCDEWITVKRRTVSVAEIMSALCGKASGGARHLFLKPGQASECRDS